MYPSLDIDIDQCLFRLVRHAATLSDTNCQTLDKKFDKADD